MTAKQRSILINTVKYIVMALLLCFFLFPYFIMISRSLMPDDDVNFKILIIPETVSFIAYTRVFNAKTIYWIGNTLLIFAINAVGTTVSASLCAYGFAKLKFKGSGVLFAIVLSTMMLPAVSMQIPLYALYTKMNWIGTWYPMTVPGFFGGGAGTIFLMRQFMKGIPNQLSEAAKIDGANKFSIYLRMIMPLCFPIMAYTVVNCFIGTWNDFMNPLMYLGTQERKYTISLGLYYAYKATANPENYPNVQMAAGVVMTLPCVILFFIFQKTLISGVTMSGIKG